MNCPRTKGIQQRQPFVAHQHQETGLGQPFRLARRKGGRAQGQGKAPVARQAVTRNQIDLLEILGAQAFDRIARDLL
jgi:hypothetical protein